jgi:hypothetical protein
MHPGSAFARPPNAVAPPFSDANGTAIYSNDVGPLIGQFASLREQEPLDESTRALWTEAVSRALTGQESPKSR